MSLTDRALLRLHIEAVWGVQLPPITANSIELLPTSSQPPWKLCVADITAERIYIWRPGIDTAEQKRLLARIIPSLALPPTTSTAPHISREVVLHQTAEPTMDRATAQALARPLTVQDCELVEAFQPRTSDYYFHADRRTLIGVIISGRLLSIAHSSRRTAAACELGIETLPEARRRGYALAATILWTETVTQEGLVPFYSALVENETSLKLAAAAGYRPFARVASLQE